MAAQAFWPGFGTAQAPELPLGPLCCLPAGEPVSADLWQQVDGQRLSQLIQFTKDFPPLPLGDGIRLLTGVGEPDAALETLWSAAKGQLIPLLLSAEADKKKIDRLNRFRLTFGKEFNDRKRFKAIDKFVSALALDDLLVWREWDPDNGKKSGIYQNKVPYYNQEQDQDRTLYWGATIVRAPLAALLEAFKDFAAHTGAPLRQEYLENFVVAGTLYRGLDTEGKPVEIFQVQFTQDPEMVGRRTYRLNYCLRQIKDQASGMGFLRAFVRNVPIPRADPAIERVKRLYGEEAAVDFIAVYGSYLFLPVRGTEPDTAYCLVHYADVNPRKIGENSWLGRGVKEKLIRTNLGDLRMRAELAPD